MLPHLQFLNLSRNKIGAEGCLDLITALKSNRLLALDLSCQSERLAFKPGYISSIGVLDSLLEMLSHNNTLMHLDVSKNSDIFLFESRKEQDLKLMLARNKFDFSKRFQSLIQTATNQILYSDVAIMVVEYTFTPEMLDSMLVRAGMHPPSHTNDYVLRNMEVVNLAEHGFLTSATRLFEQLGHAANQTSFKEIINGQLVAAGKVRGRTAGMSSKALDRSSMLLSRMFDQAFHLDSAAFTRFVVGAGVLQESWFTEPFRAFSCCLMEHALAHNLMTLVNKRGIASLALFHSIPSVSVLLTYILHTLRNPQSRDSQILLKRGLSLRIATFAESIEEQPTESLHQDTSTRPDSGSPSPRQDTGVHPSFPKAPVHAQRRGRSGSLSLCEPESACVATPLKQVSRAPSPANASHSTRASTPLKRVSRAPSPANSQVAPALIVEVIMALPN